MNRREAIQRVTFLLGGTMIGAQAILHGSCTPTAKSEGYFTSDQLILLNEIGETILPATDTPGAKEADVASFMAIVVADCYSDEEQHTFTSGLKEFEDRCQKVYEKKFVHLNEEERLNFLSELDQEHIRYMKEKKKGDPVHYFRMFKELTLAGYFTSEPGAVKFLKHNPAPGRYDGCADQKPWA
jgi:hypothetical protein